MKPVVESPWVTLGNWKAGLPGAERLMRERGDCQSPVETRRAHFGWDAVPGELTDLTSRCLFTSSPEAWWPFKDEPHPRKAKGAREDQQDQDWTGKLEHRGHLPPGAHDQPHARCGRCISLNAAGKAGGHLTRGRSTVSPPRLFWNSDLLLQWLIIQILERIPKYPHPLNLLNP